VCRVVPAFDVAEGRHPGLCQRGELPTCQQFAFESCAEAFAHGVVEGVADRSHGRSDASLTTAATERQSGILTALDAVMDDILRLSLTDTSDVSNNAGYFET
jgi:hypothetical protein